MTLGDMPKELAVGYLLNQNMLQYNDYINEIEYDEDLEVVIVRTQRKTNYEEKLSKKIREERFDWKKFPSDLSDTALLGGFKTRSGMIKKGAVIEIIFPKV